jgi:DNA-binding transcriptional MerR regulator
MLSFASSAPAMFIPSPYGGTGSNHREADLQKIQKLLQSKLIGHKLSQFGLTREEIEERLQQLNDEQIHQLATQIHTLEPGGNGAIIVPIIIWLGIILLFVLEWTGITDIY